ncbi:MAG: hypothetical protein AAF719_08820 [Pseudomonadota bacterium]
MKILRAATLTVADLMRSTELYGEWLDYAQIEGGDISRSLAESWGCPAVAGRPYAVMQPASGADVFLRFIEQPPRPDYVPLTSYGWAAIEICVQDVLAVNERMLKSPFEIIGPPREIEGLPAIHPMQVKGPDGEIVYLTHIKDDLPGYDLPRAGSLIDKLFIVVMACSDLDASKAWIKEHAAVTPGRDMEIVYTMIANAFSLPMEDLHRIATMIHDRDVFLELDQLPPAATPRPSHDGMLPPCAAIGTLIHPEFDALPGRWITAPEIREGAIYQNKRAATLSAPDGTLIEIVEA